MSLYVETIGSGPDLVLLHGWGMHGGVWQPVMEVLSSFSRVHVVDLPGLGRSGSTAPYTLEALADAVAQAAPANTVVCGWSLGGQIALRWALDRPQQVRKLVLVGATPRFVSGEDWRCGISDNVFRDFAGQVQTDYRATLSRFLALQAHGGDASRETIRQLRENFFERGEPDAAVLRSGLDILLNTDLRNELQQLRMPAMILHGENDKLAPVDSGRWLARHLPAARLEICPGASHAPFLSHPSWFVAAMRDFLHG